MDIIEVKPFKTIKEQVEKLREDGFVIEDEKYCEKVLSSVNYYRLSGYFLPFKTNGQRYDNLSFKRVAKIYKFDDEIRVFLFSVLGELEIYIRTTLAYYHSKKYTALGYKDPKNFNPKHDPLKFRNNCEKQIDDNKKQLFVEHHIRKYNRQFPLWVMCELFTFSMSSVFYRDMITKDKKTYANQYFSTNYTEGLESWMHCCSDVRNAVAHFGRIYYRNFPTYPKTNRETGEIDTTYGNKLWQILMVIKQLYVLDDNKWNNVIIKKLSDIISRYKNYIDFEHINFPSDWETRIIKK
ncbi:MAG: Abi family protein [Eubacteriales bacterium]|jgi:abortive infection bacteriophage resistance protein